MFELISGVSFLGIIINALMTGRLVKGFLGVVLIILAFGFLGGMVGATAVSIAYLIYMIKSGREEF